VIEETPPPAVIISAIPDPDAPEAVEFFRWLGLCISTWAFVDRHLYQIFHHAIGFEQEQSAFLYYRNRAFNQRLRMVDDALKMFLPNHEYTERWKPLRTEAENLSYTRNIFAHHPTLRTGTSKNGQAFDSYCIYIEPYERALNNDYPGLRGKVSLELPDLRTHKMEVEQLIEKLHNFAWIAGGIRASIKAST
jgi:hypothetical protein